MGEKSMTEIKIKNQAAYIEPPPGGEELPAQCVVTNGLKDGQIRVYTIEEWERICAWLDSLPSETRRTKILKRYTLKRAESVEVETVRRDDGSVIYKLPLPIYLFDWLACLDDAGSISLTYVARHTDSYGARWELRNTGWNGDRGGYDFVVISDEELRVRALLTGQTIDKAESGKLVLEDGTEIDLICSETDSRYLLKVKYRGEEPFEERVRYLIRKNHREKYL